MAVSNNVKTNIGPVILSLDGHSPAALELAHAMIRVHDADDGPRYEAVRDLLRLYAAEFPDLIGACLTQQGFDAELAGLPGKYATPAGALLLAIDDDGTAAGCVALRPRGEGICEMKRLYVASAYRRHGLGGMLVHAILHRAKQIGYERMRLDTVPGLAAALELYRKLGFVEIAPYSTNAAPETIFLERLL